MQSPLKRIVVFDLETGGFDYKYNPITEMAAVVLCTETLEIVEEFSIVFLPRLDLRHIGEDSMKEAKKLFAALSKKDEQTNIKSLHYKEDVTITPKTISLLCEDIDKFKNMIIERVDRMQESGYILSYDAFLELLEGDLREVAKLYFDHSYNPQALEVTHMSTHLMSEEGVTYEEAFSEIKALLDRHTISNNKPIIAGHNIKAFDLDFIKKLFQENGTDFESLINSFMIDTLEWVRLRWFEMPSFNLGTCANTLGLTLKEAHRALPDTIANAKLLVTLLQSMRGVGNEQSTYTRRKFKFNF